MHRARAATVLLLWVVAAGDMGAQSSSQAFFMELPPNVLPYNVGANGWLSVGLQYNHTNAVYWTPATGAVEIGGLSAITVSRDGRTVAGDAFDAQLRVNAAVWTGGTSWRVLGSFTPDATPCDASYSSTYGVNADATVIVGLGWNGCKYAHAFRWTAQTGMVDLGTLNGLPTRANGVSADGRVVVGWGTDPTGVRVGAKWVDGVQQMIKAASGGPVGEAFAANRDGSILAGTECDYINQGIIPTGWTWTADKGVQCLRVPPPPWTLRVPYRVLINSMSDDGRVMVGSYSFGLDSEALLWLDGQVYFLRDYLRSNGYPNAFSDWVNSGYLTGVTPDGRTLVGYGAGPKTFQGYMVVLPDRGKP